MDSVRSQLSKAEWMGKSVPAFPWPTNDPAAPPTGVAPRFAIVDKLRLPSDLKPGHYLLSWRWDCEETAQVWMVRERARLVRARACLCKAVCLSVAVLNLYLYLGRYRMSVCLCILVSA